VPPGPRAAPPESPEHGAGAEAPGLPRGPTLGAPVPLPRHQCPYPCPVLIPAHARNAGKPETPVFPRAGGGWYTRVAPVACAERPLPAAAAAAAAWGGGGCSCGSRDGLRCTRGKVLGAVRARYYERSPREDVFAVPGEEEEETGQTSGRATRVRGWRVRGVRMRGVRMREGVRMRVGRGLTWRRGWGGAGCGAPSAWGAAHGSGRTGASATAISRAG